MIVPISLLAYMIDTSAVSGRMASATCCAASKPCTLTGQSNSFAAGQRRLMTLRMSCSAAPVLLVTMPMHLG